ncbi:hypothetical protein [Pengzhenrongella sicca]|uniref:Type 4a pilus biogenesis protein PilO n=1 Tax=Pengzhenrongella sicca TaxID=2819238 RepID=A0A8A4ZAF5_9MICO|nr:hypothetical protein [Pengzhenrongella sicca]QTE28009.1 hypothetical protein J4E96_11390 [Pengzhenrongella sicca]
MGGTNRSTWIGGAVFVALVIFAAAWLLAISPNLAAASDSRAQAETTRQSNVALESAITALKVQFDQLPELKAELTKLQEEIPTGAALAALVRDLSDTAAANEVAITALSPSAAVSVVAPVVAEPVAPTEAASTDTSAETATTTEAPVPAAIEGLVAIPLSITVQGSYANTLAFLDDVQQASARLFLVGGLGARALEAAAAGGGRPEVQAGDQEIIITGFAYVLTNPTAAPIAENTSPLPAAVPGKNPFLATE